MFQNGGYSGYEVKLLLKRKARCEPYPVTKPGDIYRFMADLKNESAEHVYELLMDQQHRITGVYLVGKGCVHSSMVHPAEVFKPAYVTNSPAFALVHNHPSGVPEPSLDDRTLADRISSSAELLGLDFLDFLILGAQTYCSFVERGYLAGRRS